MKGRVSMCCWSSFHAHLKRASIRICVCVFGLTAPCCEGGPFYRGEEEMCEKFFQFNRGKGQLYDGTTRLYSHNAGDPVAMYSMGGLVRDSPDDQLSAGLRGRRTLVRLRRV